MIVENENDSNMRNDSRSKNSTNNQGFHAVNLQNGGNMKKNNKVKKYFKVAVQVVSFLLLPSLFISIFQSMKDIVMGVLHQTGTFAELFPDLLLVFLVTVVTAFAGRFFCGWMCSFGSLGDAIYGIRKKITGNSTILPESIDKTFKYVKYLLLFGIIVFVWGLQIVTIPTGVSPWDLFGMYLSLGNWPSVSELVQG
ncbi:MAG: 4Fe-4S binding protein, partial [Mobilitalea sp.]